MSLDYTTVKLVHQGAVVLSVAGFFARAWASLAGAGWVRSRVAKTVPHVVDTVLLLSALSLAWLLRLDPRDAPWLTAKIVGLVVYVALGVVALRPGRPLWVRATAWMAALAIVGWIVSVAITKSPFGFFATVF
ncbi:SirB2 family protein [Aquincola tertiaricarbonis]|uniref:SirB2 family protein n=1 Tax=Aquincola tertiaricarbonis TaxID=391953 RepID=A0ABY4S9K2_AQUTE|nr:SirB2 family protein [Aquincola tertiaricarbonis]URI07919.1 SirB2 family protein [Aquincola tertiaricarbonis]